MVVVVLGIVVEVVEVVVEVTVKVEDVDSPASAKSPSWFLSTQA
jgi:hypothetical protein